MPPRTILILIVLILTIGTAYSQAGTAAFLGEIKVQSDNDAYRLQRKDGYYTNGVFVQYGYLPKLNLHIKQEKELVKITSWYSIAQKIYNPENHRSYLLWNMDRPYAGYLFVQKGFRFFYKSGNMLRADFSAGTIGRYSLAEKVQTHYHDALGLTKIRGWETQIEDVFGINGHVEFHYNLKFCNAKTFSLAATIESNLGNHFINASTGVLAKIGVFNSPQGSAFYDARIGYGKEKEVSKTEGFVYLHPFVMVQAHNSTLQGKMFSNSKNGFTTGINHFMYGHQWGVLVAKQRWTADLSFIFRQKEAKTMRKNEKYASISLAYRLKKTPKSKKQDGFNVNDNTYSGKSSLGG